MQRCKIHNTSNTHHNYLISKKNTLLNNYKNHFNNLWSHTIVFNCGSTTVTSSGRCSPPCNGGSRPPKKDNSYNHDYTEINENDSIFLL